MDKDFKVVLTGTYEGSYEKLRRVDNKISFKFIKLWLKKRKRKQL